MHVLFGGNGSHVGARYQTKPATSVDTSVTTQTYPSPVKFLMRNITGREILMACDQVNSLAQY